MTDNGISLLMRRNDQVKPVVLAESEFRQILELTVVLVQRLVRAARLDFPLLVAEVLCQLPVVADRAVARGTRVSTNGRGCATSRRARAQGRPVVLAINEALHAMRQSSWRDTARIVDSLDLICGSLSRLSWQELSARDCTRRLELLKAFTYLLHRTLPAEFCPTAIQS